MSDLYLPLLLGNAAACLRALEAEDCIANLIMDLPFAGLDQLLDLSASLGEVGALITAVMLQ